MRKHIRETWPLLIILAYFLLGLWGGLRDRVTLF